MLARAPRLLIGEGRPFGCRGRAEREETCGSGNILDSNVLSSTMQLHLHYSKGNATVYITRHGHKSAVQKTNVQYKKHIFDAFTNVK